MNQRERDRLLFGLCADVEIMRSLLGVLCVQVLSDDALDLLIEEFDSPLFGRDPSKVITNAPCMANRQDSPYEL